MSTITVHHSGGDQFTIHTRIHTMMVDQPIAEGGDDDGPTPTELFVASLASCVAFYARRYLNRHDLPEQGLAVTASYELAQRPARVSDVRLSITLPHGVPIERREALLAVASHCTVHNSLTDPPRISIELQAKPAAA
jgi:putative redox protein